MTLLSARSKHMVEWFNLLRRVRHYYIVEGLRSRQTCDRQLWWQRPRLVQVGAHFSVARYLPLIAVDFSLANRSILS